MSDTQEDRRPAILARAEALAEELALLAQDAATLSISLDITTCLNGYQSNCMMLTNRNRAATVQIKESTF